MDEKKYIQQSVSIKFLAACYIGSLLVGPYNGTVIKKNGQTYQKHSVLLLQTYNVINLVFFYQFASFTSKVVTVLIPT